MQWSSYDDGEEEWDVESGSDLETDEEWDTNDDTGGETEEVYDSNEEEQSTQPPGPPRKRQSQGQWKDFNYYTTLRTMPDQNTFNYVSQSTKEQDQPKESETE